MNYIFSKGYKNIAPIPKASIAVLACGFAYLMAVGCGGPPTPPKAGAPSAGENNDTVGAFVSPAMAVVPAGTFTMGGEGPDEQPLHIVHVDSFEMGKYEVTVGEFRRFKKSNPSYQTDAEKAGVALVYKNLHFEKKDGVTWQCDAAGNRRPRSADNEPVLYISWNDAAAYCDWLFTQTGKIYRLPTEAEWEYAAGGGPTPTEKPQDISHQAWIADNSGNVSHPVGQKAPNALGIYDITGNAWEWCQDWYEPDYYFHGPADNPKGPETGTNKALRGGNYMFPAAKCRITERFSNLPGDCLSLCGFRVVRALK